MQRLQLKICQLTDKNLAYNNCLYMNPSDMQKLNVSEMNAIVVNESIVHLVKPDVKVAVGYLASSALLWRALHLDNSTAVNTVVKVENWSTSELNLNRCASTVVIVIDTYAKQIVEIESDKIEAHISKSFANQTFCKDQRWVMHWGDSIWLNLRIANIHYFPENAATDESKDDHRSKYSKQKPTKMAVINPSTIVTLMAARNPMLKLKQPRGKLAGNNALDWDAEKLGIGGLDAQFAIIFRRAFSSRLYPPEIVRQLGVKHVKGMLLHGPPGTGKTLIARNIGKMLTDNEPKVVNGPEILNKYVGQSEENIRALFEDAIQEQKDKGDDSGLHIIIFDEIDAICRQRGTASTSGSGVHDTVVNQLLSMIDGVHALNNVLIIGMTNRKDLLDDALVRSGRLEVHIEIGLPDEEGREQIFRIHTKSLRENGKFDDNISIASLAKRTKNYTGAEIEAVVRSAVSFAMQEFIDVENVGRIDVTKLRNIMITQDYFDLALDEVKPELGLKNDDKMQFAYKRGIYHYNKKVTEMIDLFNTIVARMKRSHVMNRQAFLLTGEMNSGKTAMASFLAHESKFPFIRLISADHYVGASDSGVCASIAKIFSDAYKSDLSVIILDDIERLIGYTIGPRFSNAIFQALLTCIRRSPSDLMRKILIIGTCDPSVVRILDFRKHFDFVRAMPTVRTQDEFAIVVKDSKNDLKCNPNSETVIKSFVGSKNGVGICDLLTVLELAMNDNDQITAETFSAAYNSKFGFDDFEFEDQMLEIEQIGKELNIS